MIREEELRRFAETGVCLGEVRESEAPIRLRSGQAHSTTLRAGFTAAPLTFKSVGYGTAESRALPKLSMALQRGIL